MSDCAMKGKREKKCRCGKRWRVMQPGFYVVVVWPTRGHRRYYSTMDNARTSFFSGNRDVGPRVFVSYHAAQDIARELVATKLARKAFVRCAKVLVRRRAAE